MTVGYRVTNASLFSVWSVPTSVSSVRHHENIQETTMTKRIGSSRAFHSSLAIPSLLCDFRTPKFGIALWLFRKDERHIFPCPTRCEMLRQQKYVQVSRSWILAMQRWEIDNWLAILIYELMSELNAYRTWAPLWELGTLPIFWGRFLPKFL